ncbi:MAG: iron ABC transporter permease [Actinomycetales bacterium]|jgi:iron complex transport system permease protein|nr:iron ABC transporter permease [Actinomycetales bacterium]
MTAVVGPALGRDRRAPDGRPPLGAAAGRRAARRRWAWLAAALVLLVLAVVASLALGARAIAPGDVLAALVAPQDGLADHTAVRSLRVPRTLVGLLAGAAFAVAGGVLQSLTRNPLADPGLLGVNAGASLAVVLAVTLLGVTAPAGYVWFALAGAAAAAALVYAVGSSGRLGGAPTTLALAGAALTAGLTSLTTMLVVRDVEAFDAYRFWVVGSLTARGVDAVVALAPFLAAGALAAVAAARVLDVLALGDDTARALGQHVGAGRAVAIGAAVLLAGAATALAGPVVFVGLVVPHLVRRAAAGSHAWLFALAAPVGAALLLAADVVGRLVARPGEVEAGLVVAFLGGPVMIALVHRARVVRP